MVTLQTADNVLKTYYLDAIKDALDVKANPLLAKLQRTSANIVGKDVSKTVRFGIHGGVGAGSEIGALPQSSSSVCEQFKTSLKNLYGTIEISDKAIRASAGNDGAFVSLLNDEMQALIKAASFNFGRMLFGDGKGRLACVSDVATNAVLVDNVNNLAEGMMINFCDNLGNFYNNSSVHRITKVDRAEKIVELQGPSFTSTTVPKGCYLCVQGSSLHELTGLGAIFSNNPLYGISRTSSAMTPYMKKSVGSINETIIQTALDSIEESSGSKVDFIVCSWGVRRALLQYYKSMQTSLPTMELEGGFTALSFNGIPVVADRFCPAGTMYLLNTNDFKIHQLGDWQWMEGEDGKILKQVPGKPVYTATLVKYAELMCENPSAQGRLYNITEV